jgi:hypothetical protein
VEAVVTGLKWNLNSKSKSRNGHRALAKVPRIDLIVPGRGVA